MHTPRSDGALSIVFTGPQHSPRWFHSDAPHLGAINTLSTSIAKAERRHPGIIPDLRRMPTLLLGSDYGGMHRSADFEVISLLASNLEAVPTWDRARTKVRNRLLPDERRISFKSLNDRHQRAAVGPFLDAANQLRGLLFTVAIHRRVQSVFKKRGKLEKSDLMSPELAGWKTTTAERALRVIHLGNLLLRGLSRAGQDVLWMTDQDEIVANESRLRSFVNLFATVSGHYIPHAMRHVRIGTTVSDTGRRDIEDYVAVCDVAAGALQHCLTDDGAQMVLKAPSLFLPRECKTSNKASEILIWLSNNECPLKRLTFLLDESSAGQLQITTLRLHGSNDQT